MYSWKWAPRLPVHWGRSWVLGFVGAVTFVHFELFLLRPLPLTLLASIGSFSMVPLPILSFQLSFQALRPPITTRLFILSVRVQAWGFCPSLVSGQPFVPVLWGVSWAALLYPMTRALLGLETKADLPLSSLTSWSWLSLPAMEEGTTSLLQRQMGLASSSRALGLGQAWGWRAVLSPPPVTQSCDLFGVWRRRCFARPPTAVGPVLMLKP